MIKSQNEEVGRRCWIFKTVKREGHEGSDDYEEWKWSVNVDDKVWQLWKVKMLKSNEDAE